ncbi:hypothetical protein ACJ41O_011286 [Fusarium nematophilum]
MLHLDDHFSPSHVEVEDPFLAALVNGELPSPSTYPPFTDPDSRQTRGQGVSQPSVPQASTTLPPRLNSTATAPRNPSTNCLSNLSGPERSTTQLSSSTNAAGESQSTLRTLDSFDEHDLFESPASSFSDAMPPSLRRSSAATGLRPGSGHTSKRRRTSTNAVPATLNRSSSKRKQSPILKDFDDDVFGPSPPRSSVGFEPRSDLTTIDLTETNEVPEEPKKPDKDNRTKLAAFQCVICMDDATNLTVTHCGHLYCASCLHQSLHVEATKGKCPMCRQKLDMKARDTYNSKTKGFWPLELKLMTATRKGKRKASTLS